MGIRGIGGIFFKANDPDALADWYETHLGVWRDAEGYTVFGWREADRPERYGETVWSAFPRDTSYFEPSSAEFMISYRVEDLDAELARLADEGVQLVGEPESFDYGRFGWVLDCEGNKVELWEPPLHRSFAVTVPEDIAEGGAWLCEPGKMMAAPASDQSERRIRHEVVVELPAREVWRLWTTSDGLAEWWVEQSDVELAVGGRFELRFASDAPAGMQGSEGCKFLAFVPERMVSFTWNAPPKYDYTRERLTHVVLELEEDERANTLVRLTHLGWPTTEHDDHPQWAKTFDYFDEAWRKVLDMLADHAA